MSLCSWNNLLLAYQRASKGKRGQPNVAVFEHHLEDNLWQLQQELLSFTYRPGAYNSFYIHEPKRRLKRRKGIYYRQRLRALVRDYAQANVSFDQLTASVRGWVNHVRYGNTIGLRKAVLTRQMIPPPQQR